MKSEENQNKPNVNKEIFEKMARERVLIIGDVMIDSYMWGNVTRISPEAPVPVVAITKREKRLGGAANVALNIEAMGATPIICSVLGNDDSGKDFQQLMYSHSMDRRGIVTSDNRMTTVKSRVIGNNMHIVRVDEESTHPLSAMEEDQLLDRITRILKTMPIDAIIFQDYDKGNITPRIIAEVTEMARRKKILTTVDPKHRNFSNFKHVGLFKPNLKELREGLNIEIDDSNDETLLHDLEEASRKLHSKQQADIVLVTLSSRGMYACDFRGKEPQSIHVPSYVHAVSDVSGAGDTVISVITLALAAGMSLEESVRCANLAGGVVCEQVGVVPIDRERLIAEMQ
ncbi:MAG: bifunctional hydroxymethylpyrimidine kinase/phosphomethylpyrimidine kinase [Bacteroidales bacterium]|jgi:rfaE bifunctional protein kinase chain/domain|nr:bifunctional hydroxymethylpyrimidine kinase/phosphomethylpyrimidine kinase [Bacteroidales bacterium]